MTRHRLEPVPTQRSIRRNTVRMLRAVFAGKDLLRRAAERLPRFGEPALIVWAKGDWVMPPEHGRRLAGLLPQAQLSQLRWQGIGLAVTRWLGLLLVTPGYSWLASSSWSSPRTR